MVTHRIHYAPSKTLRGVIFKRHLFVGHSSCFGLVWKTLVVMFLSVGHRNFVNVSRTPHSVR
jgi:hypothetical protein